MHRRLLYDEPAQIETEESFELCQEGFIGDGESIVLNIKRLNFRLVDRTCAHTHNRDLLETSSHRTSLRDTVRSKVIVYVFLSRQHVKISKLSPVILSNSIGDRRR